MSKWTLYPQNSSLEVLHYQGLITMYDPPSSDRLPPSYSPPPSQRWPPVFGC